MSYPLAVCVNVLGERSETFLRRHVLDLLPGRTVAVGQLATPRDWEPPPPIVPVGGTIDRRSVVAELHRRDVRVLLAEYLDESLPWVDALAGTGIRLFAHAHGYDVSQRLRDEEWRTAYLRYRAAAGVITMSEHSRRRLVDLGLPEAQVHAVPYGIDVLESMPVRPRAACVRVLAVGRMVPKKAPLLLLDAFKQALLAHGQTLHLDYVGSGPLLASASEWVATNGLAGRVTLHGGLANDAVVRMMRDADIFVQHSITDAATGDQEGLPVAILEAMASGLPVVATRHAGIPEAVTHGVSGFLVDEHDTRRMAGHIIALGADAGLRQAIGTAAFAVARARFSWDRERSDLLRILGLAEMAAA